MAENEPRNTMSRRARVRAAQEAGTLDALPADVLADEVAWRVSAGALDAPKSSTKAAHVAALSETEAPTRTASPRKAAPTKKASTTRAAAPNGTPAQTPTVKE